MSGSVCPVPSRWVLDELAARLRAEALEAAEREVAASVAWLVSMPAAASEAAIAASLDRHLLAVLERDALRDGRP